MVLRLFLYLILALPSVSFGANYYARDNGSGTACSLATPCNNLATLVNRSLNPGDMLHLACGDVFRHTADGVETESIGSSTDRITLQSYAAAGVACYQRNSQHTGANNSASLVDSGVNFATLGVLQGHMLFNRTKGAYCVVQAVTSTPASPTTNNTLTCAMPLAHVLGAPHTSGIDFDTGDRYEIDNRPIVTRTDLLGSGGWSHVSSNVWGHPVVKGTMRSVWINGKSTHDMMWPTACSAGNMASAADMQYCSTGTRQDEQANEGTLYIKSNGSAAANNPGNRWTNPGVEAAHQYAEQSSEVFFRINHASPSNLNAYWTVKDIVFEKMPGTILSLTGSHTTLHNVRLGLPQRKNCIDGSCWQGNPYPWQEGGDGNGRGGELLDIRTSNDAGARTDIVLSQFHGYDCENNCISITGLSSFTVRLEDCEIYGNEHSSINTSFGDGTVRNVTIDRCTFHRHTTLWHSGEGSDVATHTATFRNNLVYDTIGLNDPRLFAGSGDDDQFAILLEDRGTYTHTNNIIAGSNGTGMLVRCTAGCSTSNLANHRVLNSIYYGNDNAGLKAQNTTTRVRIQNSILAQNGSGGVSSSSFQVGCNQNCGTADDIFQDTLSENNKFRHPSGSSFAHIAGIASPLTNPLDLTEWQGITDGDDDSVVSADCFVNPAGLDFNLAPGCNDIVANRGPFRELTFATATLGADKKTITTNWTIGGVSPLSKCDKSKLTVTVAGSPATVSSCSPGPGATQATFTLQTAATAAQTVTAKALYGAVEDNVCIGGCKGGAALNARSREMPGTVTLQTGGDPDPCVDQSCDGPCPPASCDDCTGQPCDQQTCPQNCAPCELEGCTDACPGNCPLGTSSFHFRAGTIRAAISRTALTPGGAPEYTILRTNTLAIPADIDGDCTEPDWEGATVPVFETNELAQDSTGNITRARFLWVNGTPDRLCGCTTMADTVHVPGSVAHDTFQSSVEFREHFWDTDVNATHYSPSTKKVQISLANSRYDAQGVAPPDNTLNDLTWNGNIVSAVSSVANVSHTIEWCADLGADKAPGDQILLNMRLRDFDTTHANAIMRGSVNQLNALANALRVELSNTQVAVVVDDDPMTVTNCVTSGITQSAFTVQCDCSESGTAQLFWGPDGGARTNQSSTTAISGGKCTNSITSGLVAGTAYDYHMVGTDQAGNPASSAQGNVTTAPAPSGGCSHFVSPTGTGDHSTAANAGQASGVWSKLTPGETVCFANGTYTGANSMVTPTPGMSGNASNYITIKATNEGQAFLDGQQARSAIVLDNNRYVIVEGFDTGNGARNTVAVRNTTCPTSNCSAAPVAILRRIIGFDALVEDNSAVFGVSGSTYILLEDIAAWGTGRKIFQPYQSHHVTFRRAFGQEGGGGTDAQAVQEGASLHYESYFITFENTIMSWNHISGVPIRQPYAILTFARIDNDAQSIHFPTYGYNANGKVLGSLFYVLNGFTFPVNENRAAIWEGNNTYTTDILFQDVVTYLASNHDAKRGWFLEAHSGASPADKTVTRATNIGARNASIHANWAQSNVNNFASPGAANIFTSTTQARLCFRYVNGAITTQKLWPWPMDSRIVAAAARASSSRTLTQLLGSGATNVTDMIADHFGAIPAACTN